MSTDENEQRTSGGVPVTDELLQELADEAEGGYDVVALRRRGGRRPPSHLEEPVGSDRHILDLPPTPTGGGGRPSWS